MKSVICIAAAACVLAFGVCSYTTTLWCQSQAAPWPVFHHDAGHTGRSSYSGPSAPLLWWSYQVSSTGVADSIPASTIGSGRQVCVGAYLNVFAFNPDGTQAWSYATDGRTSPPALGGDGRIYVGGADGCFRSIDSNGTLVWQTSLGLNIKSGAVLGSDGTISVGGGYSSKSFYVLNSNGAIKWSYLTAGWVSCSPAMGSSGRVYVGSRDNRFYAFDSQGTCCWSFVTGFFVISSPSIGSDERVYVGSYDNRLYAFSSNGALCWSFATRGYVCSSTALGNDEKVYVGSADDRFYVVNSDGTLGWSYVTGDGVFSSPALGDDGRVYVGSWDNNLYVFNSNGTLDWSYLTGDYVASSPSLGSEGEVYFGSDDLVFYCIKGEQTETPTITPFPTNSPTPTITSTPVETPTQMSPTSTPTVTPTAPIPPLVVIPGPLTVGQSFSLSLALTVNITQPFDFYLFADSPAGIYSIYLNGNIRKGLKALYKNAPKFNTPYSKMVSPAVRIPASMAGKTITFYALVVEAGKMPPVKKPSDLTPSTPYVIMMAKSSATVEL